MLYRTNSEEETKAFASALADVFEEGDTVLLEGDLGTGKSVFVRGFARALGITGAMPSPTFTLMIPYEGRKKLYHFDLYRLADEDEFYAAGLDEFIGGDGIALVEWPSMAALDVQPAMHIEIKRTDDDDDNARSIVVSNNGIRGFKEELLKKWECVE